MRLLFRPLGFPFSVTSVSVLFNVFFRQVVVMHLEALATYETRLGGREA